jgi:dolichol-phosphate mannosyltransferase
VSSEPEVSVVVPTYNERDNIAKLIHALHEALSEAGVSYEVVVVDDNSPDGTAEVARSLSSRYNVHVLVRPGKLGLASAILDGVRASRGRYVAVMDADLQHPPEVLPKLVEMAREGCDVVIGSRYVRGGATPGWSSLRRLVSWGANTIARLLLPRVRGVRDAMSGYFVFRREVIEGVELNPRGFKFLLELLVKGRFSRVCEYPIVFRPRVWGESKLGVGEVVNYILHVLDLAHDSVRFAIVGGLGTLVNLATVALTGYYLGIEHWVSVVTAFEVSTLFNYTLHEVWTFKTSFRRGFLSRLLKFHGAVVVQFLSQMSFSNLLYYAYGVGRLTAQLVGIVVGFILNYLLSKFMVWRRTRG